MQTSPEFRPTLGILAACWLAASSPMLPAQIVGFDNFETPQHLTWAYAVWWGTGASGHTEDLMAFGVAPGLDGRAASFTVDYSLMTPALSWAGDWMGGGANIPITTLDRPWSDYRISFDYRTIGLPAGLPTPEVLFQLTADFSNGTTAGGFNTGPLPGTDAWQHVTMDLRVTNLQAVRAGSETLPLLTDPRGAGINWVTLSFGLNNAVLPWPAPEGFMVDNFRMEIVPEPASYGMILGLATLAIAVLRRRRTL